MAYDMRISDWSSDVCSSDLATGLTGFVVTDRLLDTFASAKHLTLRSANSLDFVAGSYDLGDLRLDTRALRGLGGDVAVSGGAVELSNSYAVGRAAWWERT